MCGIAGLYIKDPSAVKTRKGLESMADMLLLGIEGRGKLATGFVAVAEDGTVVFDKADTPARDFMMTRQELPERTRILLLHTRFTTKGSEKVSANNHPVIYNSCFTTHNGSVSNDDALFEKHELERRAEVDTEIISALMDKAEGDIEKIKEYFSDMAGPVACATIDVQRHPDRLILARTVTSPLVWIEQPKFIMWASTVDCMRDAWGAILGTPPGKRKFKDLPIREMLVVTPSGVEKHSIPFVSIKTGQAMATTQGASTSGTTRNGRGGLHAIATGREERPWRLTPIPESGRETNGTSCSTAGDTSRDSDDPGEVERWRVSNEDIRNNVYAQRRQDTAVAKVMSMRHKYDAEYQDGPWVGCGCCNERVHTDNIVVCSRGNWCVDCHQTWLHLAALLPARNQEDETDPYLNLDASDFSEINKCFTKGQMLELDIWASDENFIHHETLKVLEDFTGLDADSIDWLLFRMSDVQQKLTKNPEVEGWRAEMVEKYDYIYVHLWDSYDGDEGMDGGVKALTTRKQAQLALPAPPSATPSNPHSSHPLARDWARGKEKVLQRRFAQVGDSHGQNCRFCRKKHTARIERGFTEELVQYCSKHFAKCSVRGCRGDANHTRQDGKRVCHTHARSTEGVFADSLLREEGYEVVTPNA